MRPHPGTHAARIGCGKQSVASHHAHARRATNNLRRPVAARAQQAGRHALRARQGGCIFCLAVGARQLSASRRPPAGAPPGHGHLGLTARSKEQRDTPATASPVPPPPHPEDLPGRTRRHFHSGRRTHRPAPPARPARPPAPTGRLGARQTCRYPVPRAGARGRTHAHPVPTPHRAHAPTSSACMPPTPKACTAPSWATAFTASPATVSTCTP